MYSCCMHLEVTPNRNCPEDANCMFGEAGPSERVYAVPVERDGKDLWAMVTGWDAEADAEVPAFATLVNDSADGHAILVHGGSGGVRLQPLDVGEPWSSDHTGQWGEPFLLLRSGIRTVLWSEVFPGTPRP